MYNKKEILKTIKLLHKPGTVWEIRAIDAITGTWRKRHNVGGYFNSAENLIEQIDFIKSAVGIYITLNPVNPALLSRINNRLDDAKQNYSTSDQDIIKRDWMLIDLDPKRPANISSTDDELKMSQEVAKNVSLYLQKLNFPIPISAFSGNGSHLLYKIDLPKDDDGLVKRFLEALHNKFSDKLIEIDIKVFNPARITKLYGTLTCKGDNTTERPHRYSKISKVPKTIITVTRELIESIAGKNPGTADLNKIQAVVTDINKNIGRFNLQDFITKHNIEVKSVKTTIGKDGEIKYYNLTKCPWGEQHGSGDKPGDCCIIEFPTGAQAFDCQHVTCAEKKWKDFREFYEPGFSDKKQKQENKIIIPEFSTAETLYDSKFEPTKWIVPNLIPMGLTILAGKPKSGKSIFSLNLIAALCQGGLFLGRYNLEKRKTLCLALEDGKRRINSRLHSMFPLEKPKGFKDILFVTLESGWDNLSITGLKMLEKVIKEYPDIGFIVIDTFQKIKPKPNSRGNAYESDYDAISPLQKLALDHEMGILIIHHLRKSVGRDGDIFDEVSGSLGLTAVADATIIIKRKFQKDDAILSLRGRDFEDQEIILSYNPDTFQWKMEGATDEIELSVVRKAILTILQDFDGILTISEIQGALEVADFGLKESTLKWHLREMFHEGRIDNPKRGEYRFIRFNKPTPKEIEKETENILIDPEEENETF